MKLIRIPLTYTVHRLNVVASIDICPAKQKSIKKIIIYGVSVVYETIHFYGIDVLHAKTLIKLS